MYIQFHKSENSYLIYHLWNGSEWFSCLVVRDSEPDLYVHWGALQGEGAGSLAPGLSLGVSSQPRPESTPGGLHCQWANPWAGTAVPGSQSHECTGLPESDVWCPSHAVFLYEFSIGDRPHLRATSRLPAFQASTVKCHFMQRCFTLIIYPSKNN